MDPNKIELENLTKSFEYFKYAAEIDKIEDIEDLIARLDEQATKYLERVRQSLGPKE